MDQQSSVAELPAWLGMIAGCMAAALGLLCLLPNLLSPPINWIGVSISLIFICAGAWVVSYELRKGKMQ